MEDDSKTAKLLLDGFQTAGYEVDHATDGEVALGLLAAFDHDLIVLDLMIPKIDGLSVLESVRSRRSSTPVMILSAKKSRDDRIQGLKSGGDDYLVKPFSFEELLLRVQSLLRRSQPIVEATLLREEDLTLNLLAHEAKRGGKRIELQAKEYALLEVMMRNPGKALSKSYLLEKVWDVRFDPQTNVVDVLVCRLRAKVDKGFDVPLIHTLKGVGYRFGKA